MIVDPVIVAGAGPTGLTLALALARHGVPSVVLDEADGPPRGGPRSAVLRPDTVALYERLGHRGPDADGARWSAWRTVRRRQEVLRVDFAPGPSGTAAPGEGPGAGSGTGAGQPASPLHVLQHRLQHGLAEAAAGQEPIRLVPGCRVVRVEQDDDGVTVHTDGGPAPSWRGSFLVGCDGPRSTVRKLLRVRFPGRTAVDRYAVAVLRAPLPFPGESLLHRDPPWRGDTEVTARPLPDDVWRLDWRLPQATRGGSPLTPDDLVARIRNTLGGWCGEVPPYDLHAAVEYTVHQRLARRWRVGRVFLAGDAAHVLGALGMQSVDEGARDADNLAWKLAMVLRGEAPDALLDSYQTERRGAVGARLRAADQALPLLRSSGPLHAVRRSVLSGSMRRHGALLSDGNLGTGLLGAPPVHSPPPAPGPARGGGRAVPQPRTATPPGAVVEDVAVTAVDGSPWRLRDRLGRHLLVLLVAPGTGVWESRHWLTAGLMPRLAEATAALPVPAELLVTEAYPGAVAHTVLLVRPDGHLVATMTGCRPEELRAHVEAVRGGAGGPPPREPSEDRSGDSPGDSPGTPAGAPSGSRTGGS
ncbi:FAD-dependent monooxygenase [Streptomyces thermolineatus]|uniref:FAD-dependent monooxygenase n=1 Tax=Streptomyces thermolineatus TaxID=44033 RepID=A0ABN3MHG2_9ACTN